jgi:hypothetical protein
MLSAGIVTIALDLGVTITDVAVLAGYQLLVVGISGYVLSFQKLMTDHLCAPSLVNTVKGQCFYSQL